LAGGNQRIAARLTEPLGAAVHLSTAVDAVAWSDAGVRVHAAGSEAEADVCVLAVPASVTHRISFGRALPERVAAAVASVAYGHAGKLFVPLAAALPRTASGKPVAPLHFCGEQRPVRTAP
jgi:monoamine oxidase